jgi:6-pyruvoyltetrahydropterin/6-carboxytetrahydropterin synthase
MYEITKTFNIECAHRLELDYESKCRNIHGHSLKITLSISSEKCNKFGMIIDFTHLRAFKQHIEDEFDHMFLVKKSDCRETDFDYDNLVVSEDNPTSEMTAKLICNKLIKFIKTLDNIYYPLQVKVSVGETQNNTGSYWCTVNN